ncbi:MAG: hypothetical protein AB7F75_09145 [Planctomycetota bacterium]
MTVMPYEVNDDWAQDDLRWHLYLILSLQCSKCLRNCEELHDDHFGQNDSEEDVINWSGRAAIKARKLGWECFGPAPLCPNCNVKQS